MYISRIYINLQIQVKTVFKFKLIGWHDASYQNYSAFWMQRYKEMFRLLNVCADISILFYKGISIMIISNCEKRYPVYSNWRSDNS